MTSSISSILRSSLVVVAALLLWAGRADAGRRRVVVLDFEGPKAEKFHKDVVKLLKKSHTVLNVDKWNEKAEELDAGKVTEKNVKRLAKKLKLDGVVTGRIEKRRDEYIIRLKLRAGTTGEIVGTSVQTKAEGPRLDAQAQRDIKDELVAAIEELDSIRGGDDDEEDEEEEDSPRKKKKNGDDEEEEDEDRPRKSGFGGRQMTADDDEDEEESPKSKKKKKAAEEAEAKRLAKEEEDRRKKDEDKRKKDEAKLLASKKDKGDDEDSDESERDEEEDEDEDEDKPRKRKASADDDEEEDEEGIEETADVEDEGSGRDLSPAGRAVDAVVGMSFTARNLKFTYQSDLGRAPPGYKQKLPVAGAVVDVTAYPMALTKTKGIVRGIGLTILYDQVIKISSRKPYADGMGMQQIADLKTSESRWAVGPVLRYPIGKIVVGGALTYGRQKFLIEQQLPNMQATDIPNVHYTMITPSAFVRYPVTPKINVNGDLAFHAVTDTGQIQKTGMDGYGAATVTGFEVEAGADYMIMKNIFARVSVRYESIGITFKGDPTSQSNMRDGDPEQDVSAAKDTYFGGTATVGYVF